MMAPAMSYRNTRNGWPAFEWFVEQRAPAMVILPSCLPPTWKKTHSSYSKQLVYLYQRSLLAFHTLRVAAPASASALHQQSVGSQLEFVLLTVRSSVVFHDTSFSCGPRSERPESQTIGADLSITRPRYLSLQYLGRSLVGYCRDAGTSLLVQARTKAEPGGIEDDGKPTITSSAGWAISGCVDGCRSLFADYCQKR